MRIAVPLFLASLLLVACGGSGSEDESQKAKAPTDPGLTPYHCFEAFKAAVGNQDWAAIWDLTSPERRKKTEAGWKEGGELRRDAAEVATDLGKSLDEVNAMSAKEVFVAMLAKMHEMNPEEVGRMKSAVYARDEELSPSRCKVYFKRGDEERGMKFVRVDGKWYLDESIL